MSADEGTLLRIRDLLAGRNDVAEKRMFGGVCFMVNTHMACGIGGDEDLMVRLGNAGAAAAASEPHARLCDFTGRVMKTMVQVTPEGYAEDADLARWIERAVDFAVGQPPKPPKKPKSKARKQT